jgi:hypothetical protein
MWLHGLLQGWLYLYLSGVISVTSQKAVIVTVTTMRRLNVMRLLLVLFHLFLNAISSKLNFFGEMTGPADEIPVWGGGPANACGSSGLELVYFLCCFRSVWLVL